MADEPRLAFEPCPRRVRVVVSGKTVADSLKVGLLLEPKQRPVYYFPREDVLTHLLHKTAHRTTSATKGDTSYWDLVIGNRRVDNAVFSHDDPPAPLQPMKDHFAFDGAKVDHWYEEDEEVFGHAPDPYHRVDVRASGRRVRVLVSGEVIAETRRAMFLFETGHPTRYYIPQADIRLDLLTPTRRSTVCPYKGRASYWSISVAGRTIADSVWAYLDPLPECPRIKGLLCFYPEKVDAIEVEGETAR
jgi:uncharacterized protein (DUF427 family)